MTGDIRQAEEPIINLATAAVPVIGKRKDKGTGCPRSKRRFDMTAEECRFDILTFTFGIHAKLGENQWFFRRNTLQTIKVIGKRLRFVEVDVVTDKIDAIGLQKLSRRIIGKGYQAFWVNLFDQRSQLVQKTRDAGSAVPPRDVGWDFIGQRDGKHRGMTADGLGCFSCGLTNLIKTAWFIKKAGVFWPATINQDLDAVFMSQVQKPPRRNMIDAQTVGVQFPDQMKI